MTKFVCTNSYTNSKINLRSKTPFSRLRTYLAKGNDDILLLHQNMFYGINIPILLRKYPRQVTTHTTAPFVTPFFTYCALNRVCLYSFPTDTTGPLSRVYNHLPTTASNHHFRLSCIHLQSIAKQASSPISHPQPGCSIVGAIITRSSAYSNSEGRPLLASLKTTSMTAASNSGLSTDP